MWGTLLVSRQYICRGKNGQVHLHKTDSEEDLGTCEHLCFPKLSQSPRCRAPVPEKHVCALGSVAVCFDLSHNVRVLTPRAPSTGRPPQNPWL